MVKLIVGLQGQPCWWRSKKDAEILLLRLKAKFYARCGRIPGIVLRRSMAFQTCVHTHKFAGVQRSLIQAGMQIWSHICVRKRGTETRCTCYFFICNPYLPDWDVLQQFGLYLFGKKIIRHLHRSSRTTRPPSDGAAAHSPSMHMCVQCTWGSTPLLLF